MVITGGKELGRELSLPHPTSACPTLQAWGPELGPKAKCGSTHL